MSSVIYSKKYPKQEQEWLNEALKENTLYETALTELSVLPSFKTLLQQWGNSKCVPMHGRLETAEVFIRKAKSLSELYEIDIEIRKNTWGYTASLSFDIGSLYGFLKSIITMADDISFVSGINGRDITISLDFCTHMIFSPSGKQILPPCFLSDDT